VRVAIVGIGMGPQHLTREAADALRESDYVLAARKSDQDGLLAVRHAIAAAHGLEVVEVADPPRDRRRGSHYGQAVAAWHAARVGAYEEVLRERGGKPAFLVWGDPSLYDSTIRVVDELSRRIPMQVEVLPGISAPQLLAARHRIVLHRVGEAVHLTTARRLREDIAAGQRNLCVLLNASMDLSALQDWSIWWGANLGTDSEELCSGRVGEVVAEIERARARAQQRAGWVLDLYLLRAPDEAP